MGSYKSSTVTIIIANCIKAQAYMYQLLTYYTAEVEDFAPDTHSLVFASLVEGVTACVTINTTEDQLLEGPETFAVQIAENSSFPDAEVFHNELLLMIRDQGSRNYIGYVRFAFL